MSAKVKLSTKLPGDEDTNGLDAIADDLRDHPHTIRCALVWIDVSKVTRDVDTETMVPTVRIRRVEALGNVDDVSESVRKLAQEAHEIRTGKTPLPFDVIEYVDETL